MNTPERERFEGWLILHEAPLSKPRDILCRLTSDEYASSWTESMWQSYQAALASRNEEVKELEAERLMSDVLRRQYMSSRAEIEQLQAQMAQLQDALKEAMYSNSTDTAKQKYEQAMHGLTSDWLEIDRLNQRVIGFNACVGRTPDEIDALLVKAKQRLAALEGEKNVPA